MGKILIIILLILLLGGGEGYYGYNRYGGRGVGGVLACTKCLDGQTPHRGAAEQCRAAIGIAVSVELLEPRFL